MLGWALNRTYIIMETETIELLQVLQLACSQNPEELKVGEKHLEAWKRQEGFYSGLAVSSILYCHPPVWRDQLLIIKLIPSRDLPSCDPPSCAHHVIFHSDHVRHVIHHHVLVI